MNGKNIVILSIKIDKISNKEFLQKITKIIKIYLNNNHKDLKREQDFHICK